MSNTRRPHSAGYNPSLPRKRHHHDQQYHDQHLAVEHHPRRRDSSASASSDYDAPRRRHHRNVSSPPYRPTGSHSRSPSHRGSRYEETPTERLPRSKSMRVKVHRRSPSPAGRRSTDERGRTHGHHERYHSPSPTKTSHRREHSVGRGRDRQPSPARRHRSHPPPASNRHPHTGLSPRWQGAAAAAFQAGSLAALAMRSEPGAWNGSKGARVATAALGAGMIKAVQHQSKGEPPRRSGGGGGRSRSNDRDSKSRKSKMKNKGIDIVGAKLSGLVAKEFARDKHSMH